MPAASNRATSFSKALNSFSAGDADGWMEIFGDDAVHEIPFSPTGQPNRFEGKAEITEHIRQILSFIEFTSFDIAALRETDDALIAELRSTGQIAHGGDPFTFDYVWIFDYDGDRVSLFRDYMNPLQLPDLS